VTFLVQETSAASKNTPYKNNAGTLETRWKRYFTDRGARSTKPATSVLSKATWSLEAQSLCAEIGIRATIGQRLPRGVFWPFRWKAHAPYLRAWGLPSSSFGRRWSPSLSNFLPAVETHLKSFTNITEATVFHRGVPAKNCTTHVPWRTLVYPPVHSHVSYSTLHVNHVIHHQQVSSPSRVLTQSAFRFLHNYRCAGLSTGESHFFPGHTRKLRYRPESSCTSMKYHIEIIGPRNPILRLTHVAPSRQSKIWKATKTQGDYISR